MSVTCKEPKLRFSEFSGKWVEKKLEDITKINQGLQIAITERFTEQVEDSSFYITNEFLKENSEKKYFIKNPPSSVVCNKDDILMTRTGNTGQVVTNVEGAFHNNFFKIKYAQSVNKDFLVYFLRAVKTQNNILKLAGTSTIPDLNHGDFYKIKIDLPSKPEQEKIASFLTVVDAKIEQLTCKEKLLKKYKKSAMQKLFSQEHRFTCKDGSEYPEWEEKKLEDIASFSKGKSISKSDLVLNGTFECVTYGELYTTYNETIKEVKSKTSLEANQLIFSEYNDVLIPASGETQIDIATASCILKDGVALGGDLNIIKTNDNGVFLAYYLNNKKKKDIAQLAQGISVVHLYASQLKSLHVKIPSIPEQTKIANFLSAIDEKCLHVKSQLEQTQQFKKALLQQMFV